MKDDVAMSSNFTTAASKDAWKVLVANQLCSKITKGTTPPSSEIVLTKEVPFLRVNNLTVGGSRALNGELIYVSRNAHTSVLARSMAFPGDVLMNIVGPPLGKVTLLDSRFREYNLNQAVIIFRCKPQELDREFLYQYLNSQHAQAWLETRSKKTSGQQNLTIEVCKGLPVPSPPLPEQKKIADILSTWDAAIETTSKLLANAESQKRALMQQLLTGKRRLKGASSKWITTQLGEVLAAIKGGGTPDRTNPAYWNGDIPWMSVKDLRGEVIFRTQETITELGLQSSASNVFDAGTIIMSTRMAVGKTVLTGARMSINQDLKALIPKKTLSNGYLFHAMQLISKKLERLGTGSTVKGVGLDTVKEQTIRFPEKLTEQNEIAKLLDYAKNEAASLASKLELLRAEKRALMQQLLTGKRRVKT